MAREIHKGQWVRHGQKTAIVVRTGPFRGILYPSGEGFREEPLADGMVRINYVDDEGQTVLASGIKPVGFGWQKSADADVPISDLKQAKISQIPSARIKGVSKKALASLGYE